MTGWDGWMASPTQWTWVWVNSEVYSNGGCKESDMTEWLNWTELNWRSLWEYCDWDLYLGLTDSTHGFASVPQTSCVHLIKSSSHCSLAELLECSKVSFWNVPKSGTWKRKVYIFICLLPFVVTRMSGCMLLGSVSSQQMGRDDPLEWEMATHSRILAWRIPWTEESGGLQSMGS